MSQRPVPREVMDDWFGAQVVEVPDCYTLISEDRPRELAALLRAFIVPAAL